MQIKVVMFNKPAEWAVCDWLWENKRDACLCVYLCYMTQCHSLFTLIRLGEAFCFVWYGGLLLALCNYNGLIAPRLNFYDFRFQFTCFFCCCSGWVPCSSSVHRPSGKKAAVPIYKVLVRPGWESNSRPTSTEADALTTRPRAVKGSLW